MDKQTFLNLAPEYYLLALFIYLHKEAEYYTDIGWRRDFSSYDTDVGDSYCSVERASIPAEAIRLMHKHGAIRIIDDPFGPPIWQKTEILEALGDQLSSSPASVFFKARAYGDPKSWLTAALKKLNRMAEELKITSEDFPIEARADLTLGELAAVDTAEENRPDEWAPITIDQADPAVAEATRQLNAATEAIEHDNGYSVTHPQERDAVVSDLKGGLVKLKSGVVSVGWLRKTAIALKTASFRFANTVKGQMIDGAMMALKEVVKSHVSHAIEHLLGLFH